jgi:hypothetical protein
MSHDLAARVAAAQALAAAVPAGSWSFVTYRRPQGRQAAVLDAAGTVLAVDIEPWTAVPLAASPPIRLMAAAPDLAALVAELWAELARVTAERDRLTEEVKMLIEESDRHPSHRGAPR